MTKMSGMPIFRLFCQLMISFRRDWIGVMGKTIAWQKNKKKLKFSTSVNKKKKTESFLVRKVVRVRVENWYFKNLPSPKSGRNFDDRKCRLFRGAPACIV